MGRAIRNCSEQKDTLPVNSFPTSTSRPRCLKPLAAEGYETPTPIQARPSLHLLAGRDLLGIAQTGTGKTAAFALPMLALVAAKPTRGRGTPAGLWYSRPPASLPHRSANASAPMAAF